MIDASRCLRAVTAVLRPSFSWSSLGACLHLEHLDLSGCDKITDHALKRLSVALGDLIAPPLQRRAKLAKSSPLPIRLAEQRNLEPPGRKRQALIFKQAPGRWGIPTRVWVLDSSDLADIEDAAEWSRRDGAALSAAGSFVDAEMVGTLCCCRRSRKPGHRAASYLQQQFAVSAEGFCGHSTCCVGDTALRTLPPQQRECESSTTEFRTKCSSSARSLQCLSHGNRTDQSEARRRLRFLSLSGCYQVTDLGLR